MNTTTLESNLLRTAVQRYLWLGGHDDSDKFSKGRRRYLCNAISSACMMSNAQSPHLILDIIRMDATAANPKASDSFPRLEKCEDSQMRVAMYGLLLSEYWKTDGDEVRSSNDRIADLIVDAVIDNLWHDDICSYETGDRNIYLCDAISRTNKMMQSCTAGVLNIIAEDAYEASEGLSMKFPRKEKDAQMTIATYGLLLAEYWRTDAN